MVETSRFPGFYKLSMHERRGIAAEALGISMADLEGALEAGGLSCATADKAGENVLGTYALPFGIGLNVQINGRDYLAPMVVEEPSVVAAASNAARMIRAGGGFDAEADESWMIAQVQVDAVEDPELARRRILEHRVELLRLADAAVPNLIARGGGARELEVRNLGEGMLVVHVYVDCRDAMGANLVNTVAERTAERIAELAGGVVGLRILSNLCDRRCVRVRGRVPLETLAVDGFSGEQVREGIVRASRFAELDPYRAATHNKGILNGVDAVVMATGNDWRAVEAGAHAYASRRGTYEPLCTWRRGEDGSLIGTLELPLALGIVGGTARIHRGTRLALQLAGVSSSQELAMLVGCMGMASNLAALRALATAGIQRGHMALHARSVAIAAGAQGSLVEDVARDIHAAGQVTLEAARLVLARLFDADVAAASGPVAMTAAVVNNAVGKTATVTVAE